LLEGRTGREGKEGKGSGQGEVKREVMRASEGKG